MRHADSRNRRRPRPQTLVLLAAGLAVCAGLPSEAHAGTTAFVGLGRMATAVISPPAPEPTTPEPTAPEVAQQEEGQREAPPFTDPASGAVFSIFGGSVFSGSSAFQTGAALAYFFGEKATFGFEVEGNFVFGPGGRVGQVMGSFVVQTGARTSKFVPYIAGGAGYLTATSKLPDATQAVLDDLGVVREPETERAPFVHFGGGLRFYIKPTVAFRADVRFAQVALDLRVVGRSNYPMRRIAGMLSWDF